MDIDAALKELEMEFYFLDQADDPRSPLSDAAFGRAIGQVLADGLPKANDVIATMRANRRARDPISYDAAFTRTALA